jgi:hypothetical protein
LGKQEVAVVPNDEPTPHPLIRALAEAVKPPPDAGRVTRAIAASKAQEVSQPDLAAFADRAEFPAAVALAGYLGAEIPRDGHDWWVLYLDVEASRWLLVRRADMLFWERADDRGAPHQKIDRVWLSEDALVVEGSGHDTPETRFVSGPFMRAGDFRASASGGTFPSVTGVFCSPDTPYGCTRHSL